MLNSTMSEKHYLSCTCLGLILLTPSLLFAQPQTNSEGAFVLEELIVTARKREQNLQDVALSVSLLSGKALAEAHLQNAVELSNALPTLNLQASSGPGTSSFNIRGIGTRTFVVGVEPSVSTMLDGVVMARSGMSFIDLIDIQRVEILRGPQGTLYGKNASGGVVHMITKDPTEELTGTVALTAIEQDEYRLNGTISGPISDQLTFRLTGNMVDDGGWAKNVFDGEVINNSESWALRGKLLWLVNEDMELLWSSDVSDSECNCTALSLRSIMESPLQESLLLEQFPVVPGKGTQDVNNDQDTLSDTSASGHSLTVNWNLSDYQLTSITAWREWQNESVVDFDRRPTNPLSLGFPILPYSDLEQFSQEVRLSSEPADWGSLVLGAFYFDHQINGTRAISTALGAPFIPAGTQTARSAFSSENYALFGEVSFSLADSWELTLGGRYTRDKVDFYEEQLGTHAIVFPTEAIVSDKLDESNFSPKLALQWNATDRAMLYASYVKGYKGPALDFASLQNEQAVEAETSDAYELGLKSSWLDGRLIVNVAAFYAEYQNFQADSYVDTNEADRLPGTFILVNAGEISTQGIELEIISRPTDNWNLSGGLAWTDATIDDFPGGPCTSGQIYRGECPDSFLDLSGGRLPTTPQWKLNLSTSYTWQPEQVPFNVILGASIRAQDDVHYGISQDLYNVEDAFTVVDASLTLAGREGDYRFTAFVKNLFDEDYASIIYANEEIVMPNAYVQMVPKYAQRTAGVELRYDF
ncbi:MAG: iron complex outermembrane receptor protein [Halieaceae bacterium]|jgi:iron complex outermembrane receptor protein